MSNPHPHAAVIDRLGRAAIRAHFDISEQAVSYWRRKGVPVRHRKTLAMLCAVAGCAFDELNLKIV